MTRSVLLIGGGGHAKVLIDALLLQNISIVGIVDAQPGKIGTSLYDVPVIGNDEYIFAHFAPEKTLLVNGIGTAVSLYLRKQVYTKFKGKGYSFFQVVHPAATVSPFASIEEGVQIMAGAVIQAGCKIGSNTIVNTRATVDHDCQIADHVHVAPGCTLCGNVCVATETHIGAGATVIQGRRIGSRATVGAGAVVIEDVEDGKKVVGVPARMI